MKVKCLLFMNLCRMFEFSWKAVATHTVPLFLPLLLYKRMLRSSGSGSAVGEVLFVSRTLN